MRMAERSGSGAVGGAGRVRAPAILRTLLLVALIPLLGATGPSRKPAATADRTLAPAAGRLLVARPELEGPFFEKSVVLLLHVDWTGAIGVVLNRPSTLPVSHLLPALEDNHEPIFMGGPVQGQAVAFLFRSSAAPANSERLLEGVHVGGTQGTISHVIERKLPGSDFHAYMGYAGWGPMQLDHEIDRGSWWVVPATAELVFETDPKLLWSQLVREYGGVLVHDAPDQGPPLHAPADGLARLPAAGAPSN